MSCFDVQILDPNINTIEIETCIGDQPSSIDIVTYDNTSLIEVSHCVALLPSEINELITVKDILGGSGILVTSSSGLYTISLSNPSISATGIVDLLESVQDIIGNSGLLASNYISINYDDNTGFTTISTTGLQPSGNYSIVGHYHTSSDITDFNSSVSGLLPATYYAAVPWTSNHTLIDGTRYLVNDIVYENGRLYKANYDNESLPVNNTLYWTDVGPGYRLNIDGRDIPNIPYPITNLTAGSGIGITNIGTDYTISVTGTFGLTGEQVDDRVSQLLIAGSYINLNYNDNSDTLTVSVTGLQPSGSYANAIHNHISNDITDFNNSVSGLIPIQNITGVSGVQISASGTSRQISTNFIAGNGISFNYNNDESLTISTITNNGLISITNNNTTNLTIPSGYVIGSLSIYQNGVKLLDNIDYIATDGSGVTLLYPPTSGSYIEYLTPITSIQNAGNYANAIHSHLSSDITNFNSSVSGLLPSIGGDEYITTSFLNNIYTISTTGLQPSGNYANAIHSHLSSDISNFDSSVSGLLPTVSGSGYVTSSFINNSYIVSVTGLQPSGNYSTVGHSHTLSNITDASSIYDTSIYSLGTISGIVSINYGTDRMIQTFNIDTNPLTLNKGSGWPTTNISRDVLLIMNCINSTSITWNIVGEDWYNQPTTTLPSGEYMILLRAIGSGTIQGHYIGTKQGPL